jgi:hypothetical protein
MIATLPGLSQQYRAARHRLHAAAQRAFPIGTQVAVLDHDLAAVIPATVVRYDGEKAVVRTMLGYVREVAVVDLTVWGPTDAGCEFREAA